MAICTFFGHRDTLENIDSILQTLLIDLIENKNVCRFYVGNNGNFDAMIWRNLNHLKIYYPDIECFVVLSKTPNKRNYYSYIEYSDTILPDGFETVPHKYAISHRNRWMIKQSDYVVTYVRHSFGGAAQFKELAENMNKVVINLADLLNK